MTRIIKCIHRNQLPNDYAFKNFNSVVPPGINCKKLCRGSTALGNSNMLFKVPPCDKEQGEMGHKIARSKLNLNNLEKVIVG